MFHFLGHFFRYINDLFDKIVSLVKLFANDTSIFFVVNNANIFADELNKNSKWAHNGKFHSMLIRINKHKTSFFLEN